MDEKVRKALTRIEQELQECIELFENILSIGVETGVESLMLQPLKQTITSESVDMDINEAIKIINEKLEKCIKLVQSIDGVRFRVKHYVSSEKYYSLDRMWNRIVQMAYSAVRRMRTQVPTVPTQQQVMQTETKSEVKPEEIDRVLQEAKKVLEGGTNEKQ